MPCHLDPQPPFPVTLVRVSGPQGRVHGEEEGRLRGLVVCYPR